uniref:Uncharacterized protein n=1 Tax=Anguilla anguilla TaxID=7936 RepID=A0A0E9RFW1_ANGAN
MLMVQYFPPEGSHSTGKKTRGIHLLHEMCFWL